MFVGKKTSSEITLYGEIKMTTLHPNMPDKTYSMALAFLSAALRELLLHRRRPLLLYAALWTTILTVTVAVVSFAPELAFVWAIAPSSSPHRTCTGGMVRVPMEGHAACVPALLLRRSTADVVVPPLFAALVVGGSACVVRAAGLWEPDIHASIV